MERTNPMNRTERRRGSQPPKRPADQRRLLIYGTIGVVAILVIVAFAFASKTPKSASDAPMFAQLKVGQDAPSFSVSTTNGPFAVPTNDKKPVLLEVFATWCPHCQHEVTTLNKLFGKYGGTVHFVGVSGSPYGMDQNTPASQADVMNFVQRFKVQYPVAYDGDLAVGKKYLQGGFPTIVMIDGAGKIVAVRDGEISEKQLTTDLEKALKG
jgi:thiol-disulfide isomerase/thioredoxin